MIRGQFTLGRVVRLSVPPRHRLHTLAARIYSIDQPPPPHYQAQRSASGDPALVEALWKAYNDALEQVEFRRTHGKYKDPSCQDIVNEYDMKKKYIKNSQERNDVVSALGSLTKLKDSKDVERVAEENVCMELQKNIEDFELNIELEMENVAALKLEISKLAQESSGNQSNSRLVENSSKKIAELQRETTCLDEKIKAKRAEYDVLVKEIAEIKK